METRHQMCQTNFNQNLLQKNFKFRNLFASMLCASTEFRLNEEKLITSEQQQLICAAINVDFMQNKGYEK